MGLVSNDCPGTCFQRKISHYQQEFQSSFSSWEKWSVPCAAAGRLVMKQWKLSKYWTNFDSYKSCANIHFDQKWKPFLLVVLSNSCHFLPIGGLGSFTVYNPRIVLSYAYLLIWPDHLCKPLCRPYYQTLLVFNECRCFLKAEK